MRAQSLFVGTPLAATLYWRKCARESTPRPRMLDGLSSRFSQGGRHGTRSRRALVAAWHSVADHHPVGAVLALAAADGRSVTAHSCEVEAWLRPGFHI